MTSVNFFQHHSSPGGSDRKCVGRKGLNGEVWWGGENSFHQSDFAAGNARNVGVRKHHLLCLMLLTLCFVKEKTTLSISGVVWWSPSVTCKSWFTQRGREEWEESWSGEIPNLHSSEDPCHSNDGLTSRKQLAHTTLKMNHDCDAVAPFPPQNSPCLQGSSQDTASEWCPGSELPFRRQVNSSALPEGFALVTFEQGVLMTSKSVWNGQHRLCVQ